MENEETQNIRTALQQALMRLNVREYAAEEMRNYLRRKGFETAEIEEAVRGLVEKGLISDERYSRIIARHTAQRGKGPGYIQAKLRQKGVKLDASQAKRLFNETSSETELELAKRILESKYPRAKESMKERQRAYHGLIRRGISHHVARICFKELERD